MREIVRLSAVLALFGGFLAGCESKPNAPAPSGKEVKGGMDAPPPPSPPK